MVLFPAPYIFNGGILKIVRIKAGSTAKDRHIVMKSSILLLLIGFILVRENFLPNVTNDELLVIGTKMSPSARFGWGPPNTPTGKGSFVQPLPNDGSPPSPVTPPKK
ncbi:uncharacterized protein CELE_T10B10.9 [Caenorhabditis elegans]|uniref:Secreted protein n=1 Tax=Caenorhabditis elegans TaxID=6239 RepID=Q9U374_CAEEL|nr:Secreted protein [Caenorhabditis elegans]CAB54309.1 Secreted protein [Caenorhabditis elegans]|eukprot:NP_510519.1 Uncharacterized protein CELE_T10B10.9 [Caenorhabditis elegans]